ncbi:UNVERIFIED_CONTAM: hypothetical protein RF653_06935 [Kocuria sp. CPCC 205316]|uniref:hypothetical protein n=1 Tax=Kocuria TaxID=57493 RepID=UPI0036D777C6
MDTTTETTAGLTALRHEVAPEYPAAATATLRMPAEPARLHLLRSLTHGARSVLQFPRANGAPRTVLRGRR